MQSHRFTMLCYDALGEHPVRSLTQGRLLQFGMSVVVAGMQVSLFVSTLCVSIYLCICIRIYVTLRTDTGGLLARSL